MEMQTHQQSKRGSMEVVAHEEDRLSSLPDDLLHSILRHLPLKHAVRTSALSRRWASQWLRALASSRVLDLTDPDLARCEPPPARATAATVRRCLDLHAEHGAQLDVFRVALRSPPAGPSFGAFQRDVVGWIASAVAMGAREVEVDLTPTPTPPPSWASGAVYDADHQSAAYVELPGDLFAARNSLARLALGGFSLLRAFTAAPTTAGLSGLRSLSLSYCHADFNGEAVRDVVASCRALEHLSLRSCHRLESIRIASETLRVLEIVGCSAVEEVRVTAPALESIAFHDDEFYWNNADADVFGFDGDMPALRDVYLSRIPFGHDSDETYYDSLLRCVEHAPVWTLSSDRFNLRFRFDTTNMQELQLLVVSEDDYDDVEGFVDFFGENKLPLLDRLFVRFPGHVTDGSDADAAAALADGEVVDDSELEIHNEFVLDSLRFIKLVNFRGTRFELQLLAFLLKRSPAMEHLVLVTVGEEGAAPGPGDEHLEVIQRQVSAMQKACPHARLTVCRSSQDRSQNPVHTRLYDQEYWGPHLIDL